MVVMDGKTLLGIPPVCAAFIADQKWPDLLGGLRK
jgi:hypothetical protein